ncbi:sugar ABC transporter permease [Solirubrobacter sp. CPCC 204708]|uniref:Sugar ABC transporter permease n=1 Tax=Solirubrobacter deserti TaxID=2282478 RepID=A0ABT4RR87_9ACTN|nr:sugar ABC transporter permease [Solirubrobacter deserti]MBE2314742.1 sugar ABC transporter permease [Solirubrobacter deserti]MDA0141059.1 sugar ABC transporter permease [Solirubrobacter deserti]
MKRATPWLFLAPYLLLFSAFVAAPVLYGLWMSLHNWDQFLPEKPFIGLENYANLFTPGSAKAGPFWDAMLATGIFTLFSVPLLVVLPLGVALLLNRRFKGRAVFRAIYFAPYVLGVVVVSMVFRFVLDPNIGALNHLLGTTTPWTTALPWAWVSLIGMTVWWTLGFNAVIYLAGLQDIDRSLYDAAAVDGAGRWQQFWNVTLPSLRPVTVFVVTVTILASANLFGQSYLMTQGAPEERTRSAIMFIAEEGFQDFNLGSAAAMSYVLAMFLMALSAGVFFFFRKRGAA